MNSALSRYLNWEYLSAVANGPWVDYFLYLAVAVMVLPILAKIILKIRKRSEVYRKFDQFWFWTYFSLGLTGLFLWFTATQGLPLLGSRLVAVTWVLSIIGMGAFFVFYYRRVVTRDVTKYHEKKRKDKYLK